MAIDIKFINLRDNDNVLGNQIDVGLDNSIAIDLEFEIDNNSEFHGYIYKNNSIIGEFGQDPTRGKFVEWYAGEGTPIYIKDNDTLKAVGKYVTP